MRHKWQGEKIEEYNVVQSFKFKVPLHAETVFLLVHLA